MSEPDFSEIQDPQQLPAPLRILARLMAIGAWRKELDEPASPEENDLADGGDFPTESE